MDGFVWKGLGHEVIWINHVSVSWSGPCNKSCMILLRNVTDLSCSALRTYWPDASLPRQEPLKVKTREFTSPIQVIAKTTWLGLITSADTPPILDCSHCWPLEGCSAAFVVEQLCSVKFLSTTHKTELKIKSPPTKDCSIHRSCTSTVQHNTCAIFYRL